MTAEKQQHRTPLNCVICGKMFNSEYSEAFKTYPVYHSQNGNATQSCEFRFYDLLVRIYQLMHGEDQSLQVSELINRINWDDIQLRKEAILFCIHQGYLTRDNMKRLIIPPAIDDISKEIYSADNLGNPEIMSKAVEYIKSAIIVMRDRLKPQDNDEEKEIEQEMAPLLQESRKVHRMATIEMTLTNKKGSGFNLDKARRMYSR